MEEEHYAQAYYDRYEKEDEEIELHECESCQSTMIDLDEHFCNRCKKHLQEELKNIILKNFSKEEIKYLDNYIEGRYLVDIVGMED